MTLLRLNFTSKKKINYLVNNWSKKKNSPRLHSLGPQRMFYFFSVLHILIVSLRKGRGALTGHVARRNNDTKYIKDVGFCWIKPTAIIWYKTKIRLNIRIRRSFIRFNNNYHFYFQVINQILSYQNLTKKYSWEV